MSAILEFLKQIADFLISLVDGLITFLKLVLQIPAFIANAGAFIPGFLLVFLVGIIAILVIKTIINR